MCKKGSFSARPEISHLDFVTLSELTTLEFGPVMTLHPAIFCVTTRIPYLVLFTEWMTDWEFIQIHQNTYHCAPWGYKRYLFGLSFKHNNLTVHNIMIGLEHSKDSPKPSMILFPLWPAIPWSLSFLLGHSSSTPTQRLSSLSRPEVKESKSFFSGPQI